jgi:hypothetical protein
MRTDLDPSSQEYRDLTPRSEGYASDDWRRNCECDEMTCTSCHSFPEEDFDQIVHDGKMTVEQVKATWPELAKDWRYGCVHCGQYVPLHEWDCPDYHSDDDFAAFTPPTGMDASEVWEPQFVAPPDTRPFQDQQQDTEDPAE